MEYRFEIEQSHVGTADYVSDGSKAFSLFDKGRFLVKATMERGCKPILKVQFLPGSWNGEMLWDQSAQLRPTRVNKPATQSKSEVDFLEHVRDRYQHTVILVSSASEDSLLMQRMCISDSVADM